MSHSTCIHDNCEKPNRARGLCSTHYNQTHATNRHRKVEVECSACGTSMMRDTSVKRWATTYCSELCRTWGVFGVGGTCNIPANHWARMYGATCEWVAPRTPRVYQCEWCGGDAESSRDDARYCTKACKRAHGKVKRRGRERGATGDYTWMDITRLWVLFDRACAYCAVPTALTDIQAEHVVPLSKGGANNLTNLLPSCGACNADKRDLLLHTWNTDRVRRGLTLVTTEWSSDDTRYKHLTSVRPTTTAAA